MLEVAGKVRKSRLGTGITKLYVIFALNLVPVCASCLCRSPASSNWSRTGNLLFSIPVVSRCRIYSVTSVIGTFTKTLSSRLVTTSCHSPRLGAAGIVKLNLAWSPVSVTESSRL